MNRILVRLEAFRETPPELLALIAFVLVVVPFIVPRYYRLGAALAFMSAWLNLNRFSALGTIASITKVTFWLPIALVILAAILHPGPRRKITSWMYVYLTIPFIGMACVATTFDASLGLVYQLNMFLVSLMAFFVLRTIVDIKTLGYVIASMTVGLLAPLGVTTYAMIIGGHFRAGLGRFSPFEILSNQLVPILLQLIVLGMYCFHQTRNFALRIAIAVIVGMAGAQLIATGSRQGLLMLIIALLPWGASMFHRPLIAALCVIVTTSSFMYVFEFLGEAKGIARLTSTDDSNRIEIAKYYLDTIADRPVIGLFGTKNQSCIIAEGAMSHAHNAFLESLYIGGIVYTLPLLLVVAMTIYSAVFTYFHRGSLAIDRPQFMLLGGLIAAIYAQTLVSNMAFNSVSSWSFMNIFLSGFFLNLRNDLIEGRKTGSEAR